MRTCAALVTTKLGLCIAPFFWVFSPACAQLLSAQNELQKGLHRYGKFVVVGSFQPPDVCVLTGGGYAEYLFLINVGGVLPSGIATGSPETVLAVGALGEDKKTFQNCNDTPSTASANFSVAVTKTLTVSFTNGFTESVSGNLSASIGAPGAASAAIGISGSRAWSASTTTSQSTSISVNMGNSYSTPVPPGKEIDISYSVLSKRTQLPVSATGIFDGTIYPCQQRPPGRKYASELLSSAERTFTATGTIDFDNAQEGIFHVSKPRPTECFRQVGLRVHEVGQTGEWAKKGYVLRPTKVTKP